MQLREIRLTGVGKVNASVNFSAGGNAVCGESNTGKSFMLDCLDFVLDASETPDIPGEASGYSQVWAEFHNPQGQFLTLSREFISKDISLYRNSIAGVMSSGSQGDTQRIELSKGEDITAVLFAFAGMPEARLKKSTKGNTQRLTVRTALPLFLANEVSIIDKKSPAYGKSGFENSARKRMFSYFLTAQDDSSLGTVAKPDIVISDAKSKLELLTTLLQPVEGRVRSRSAQTEYLLDSRELDARIDGLANMLAEIDQQRRQLEEERRLAKGGIQKSESQILAINELLHRYDLLDQRYESDLRRLDFLSEASHYFGGLQETNCPLCEQVITSDHLQHSGSAFDSGQIQETSRAEASKIRGLRFGLNNAVKNLADKRQSQRDILNALETEFNGIEATLSLEVLPMIHNASSALKELVRVRVENESAQSDLEQMNSLREMKQRLEESIKAVGSSDQASSELDADAVRQFCSEISELLREWNWPGERIVEFDEKLCDIKVDGKPRKLEGKGFRAVLFSAFVIGLLRYCVKEKKPHFGFVILDSPLTSFKRGEKPANRDKLPEGIETAFWNSLANTDKSIQVIVLDNKEPSALIAEKMTYWHFPGVFAKPGERQGLIPPQ